MQIEKYNGNAKNIVIPSEVCGHSVEMIAAMAFYENTNLESIVIPDTVKELGHRVFAHCTNLERAVIGNSVEIIDNQIYPLESGK